MNRYRSLSTLFALLMLAPTLMAEERVILQGTSIIGNKELPKVLYIVPWKEPEPPRLPESSVDGIVEHLLQPTDRESFQRELQLHNAFPADGAANR